MRLFFTVVCVKGKMSSFMYSNCKKGLQIHPQHRRRRLLSPWWSKQLHHQCFRVAVSQLSKKREIDVLSKFSWTKSILLLLRHENELSWVVFFFFEKNCFPFNKKGKKKNFFRWKGRPFDLLQLPSRPFITIVPIFFEGHWKSCAFFLF